MKINNELLKSGKPFVDIFYCPWLFKTKKFSTKAPTIKKPVYQGFEGLFHKKIAYYCFY